LPAYSFFKELNCYKKSIFLKCSCPTGTGVIVIKPS
jgi:hypothetical protein